MNNEKLAQPTEDASEIRERSKCSHTPGPWVAFPGKVRWHSDRKPIFEDGLWHVLPEVNLHRIPICEVDHADYHHPPSRSQAEVDARLIAASPELLAACKQAKKYLEPDLVEPGRTVFWNLVDVIAKAEGAPAALPSATDEGDRSGPTAKENL